MWPVEILLESSHLDSVLILCHMVRACTGCYGDVHKFLSILCIVQDSFFILCMLQTNLQN